MLIILSSLVSAVNINTCTIINAPGTYDLTANILNSATSNCMDITTSNVVLDCHGFMIDGNNVADTAINIGNGNDGNIEVKNCILTDWDTQAIDINTGSFNIIIDNNIIISLPDNGIYIENSENITINNSNISAGTSINVDDGISMYRVNNFTIDNCNITQAGRNGINIDMSISNPLTSTIKNTEISGVRKLIDIFNVDSGSCKFKIDNVQAIDGNLVRFYNQSNININNVIGSQFILCEVNNSIFSKLTIPDSGEYSGEIMLIGGDNVTIRDSTLTRIYQGIRETFSNDEDAINYNIINNTITDTIYNGIEAVERFNVYNNTLNNIGNDAIYIDDDNNTVYDNKIIGTTHDYGINTGGSSPNDNLIYNNLIWQGSLGYINNNAGTNFWNTTLQIGTRIFGNGTLIGGNYYINATGGISGDCIDIDNNGICDLNFTENSAVDFLPLSNNFSPFGSPPVMTINFTNPKNPLSTQNINFNISCYDNEGDTITSYLQIYNNSIAFGSEINQIISNNTNTRIHVLGSGNTTGGDNWTGEYWCGDGFSNSNKVNSSVLVVNTTFINITQIRDTLGVVLTGQFNITNVNTGFIIESNTPVIINSTAGNNILTLNKTGWFEINHTVNAIQDQTVIVSSLTMYDSKFEVFVINSEDNSSIEDFNITIISNDNTSFTQTHNNVNTSMNFNLTSGSYNLTTSANGRGTDFITLNVTAGISNTTITLFPRNTINFTIIDLTNLSILNHQEVNIELIGLTRTYNINTTTGNVVITNINDDTYTVKSSSAGFDDTSIIVTTSDSSPQSVNIYMDKGKTSKLFLTIDGSTNSPVPDTILTFTRNINGTFVTTTQVVTDFTGAAIVLLNENITYTFTAINPSYNVFTGDVNPATSNTFTIDLTLTGGLAYLSLLNNTAYNTIVIRSISGTTVNTSFSLFATQTPGSILWFSTNTTYNGINYFINTSGSPGGGTQTLNIPGINTNIQNILDVNYKFKITGYQTQSWTERTTLIRFNATNISITGGLFDGTDEMTEAGKAVLAIFLIMIIVGAFSVASGSLTVGSFAGIVTMGIMIIPSVDLLPKTYGAVSLIVLTILIIADKVTGGAL